MSDHSSIRLGEQGYTLTELLVVLAILGLLAAITTPYAMHYLEGAKVRTAKAEIMNISSALDMFKFDVGRFPTTQEGLGALLKAPSDAENWNGPYVKQTNGFKDPWGHPYLFRSPGEHGDFDIYSYGPKGHATSSKPEISNW